MPIYEFRCIECSRDFEKLCNAGISPDEIECPACGRRGVNRKLSSFSFTGRGRSGASGESMGAESGFQGGCSSCVSRSCSTCHL